jgi:tetratricopeptide (TPR) repeat protein
VAAQPPRFMIPRRLVAAVGLAAQRGWDEQAGRLAQSTGDSLRMLRYLDDLLTVREAAPAAGGRREDTATEARELNNLGIAYGELRRLEEAIGCYQQSLAIFRETRDRYGEGQILTNLGNAYTKLRQPDWAAVCWRDAAAAMRDVCDHEQEWRPTGPRCRAGG